MFNERLWTQRVVPSLRPEWKQMTASGNLVQGTSTGQLEWIPLNKATKTQEKTECNCDEQKQLYGEARQTYHPFRAMENIPSLHCFCFLSLQSCKEPFLFPHHRLHSTWLTATWILTWKACQLLLWKSYGHRVWGVCGCFSRPNLWKRKGCEDREKLSLEKKKTLHWGQEGERLNRNL